jgi:hypothetical protein
MVPSLGNARLLDHQSSSTYFGIDLHENCHPEDRYVRNFVLSTVANLNMK